MELSRKALQVSASPTLAIDAKFKAMKAEGIDVIGFGCGEPDFDTPDNIKAAAIKAIEEGQTKYTPASGTLALKQAICDKLKRDNGLDYKPSNIVVSNGAKHSLLNAFNAIINPGDEIIIPEPAYANYMAFAVSCGAVIKPVKTNIENGFKLPSVEEFEKQITGKTRAILICNPNNPTGYLYTKQEMLQIRDLVKKYNLYLFSDEVYREFIYTKRPYISAFHLEGIEDHVVLIDSVSKRYSLCGIRIGALITKNKQIHSAVMKFCQARLSPPLIGQVIAESSLATPHEYLEEVYDEYLSRRNFLIDQLNQIPGVFAPTPMGAFYVMVHLPVDDTDKFCQWCLTDFQYEGQTVIMAPGSGFYTNPEDGRHQVQMAYILNKEDLAKAVLVLRKALEAYQNEKQ